MVTSNPDHMSVMQLSAWVQELQDINDTQDKNDELLQTCEELYQALQEAEATLRNDLYARRIPNCLDVLDNALDEFKQYEPDPTPD
jgi:septation ring formation regulator EzrA